MLKELVFTVLMMVGMITISILYISGLIYVIVNSKKRVWTILYLLIGLLIFSIIIFTI